MKTRFAPSPTGYLHVGGLRTALYAYLFAKKEGGKFILRIEDTDQARSVEGAQENLIRTLEWIGIHPDEGPTLDGKEIGPNGPYIQSHRKELYKENCQKLLESGHAYRCFCTKERLDEMRAKQVERKQAPMYDRHCLDLADSEIQEKIAANVEHVIRLKMPYELIKFKDSIRGNLQFDGKTIDDQVLMKSDGMPTYHLANVVDDHFMEITHVIRGEEWLPSSPKHIALYQAFGWEPPQFAHIPLLLNEDRSKLSKRQGDVAVEQYIENGYLREAIINFIVFLGWNPGDGEEREIFTLEELENVFSLEKVHKSGAIFDIEKLDWFNWKWQKYNYFEALNAEAKEIDSKVEINKSPKGHYDYIFSDPTLEEKFKHERGRTLYNICQSHLDEEYKKDESYLFKVLFSVEEKILRDPKDINEHIDFYFQLPNYDKELLTHEKMGVNLEQAKDSLQKASTVIESLEEWSEEAITSELLKAVEEMGIKNGQLLWPIRAALSGKQFSPGAFEITFALGKSKSLERLQVAISKTEK
jgi:glutamyl-tRNA synthetase